MKWISVTAVTVAALVATGRTAQIGGHVRRALDNGVTPAEIGELITQLAFYSGWPNAISAVSEVKTVFDERSIGPVASSAAARIALEAVAEATRAATVNAAVAPTAAALADLTNRVLFGDLWQRPDLSARDRSLVTMTALVAIGQPEQLPFHANRAMDNGLTAAEAAEAVTHVAFYAGWPRAMSAVPVLKAVLESRSGAAQARSAQQSDGASMDLQVTRANEGPVPGPADTFTGAVRMFESRDAAVESSLAITVRKTSAGISGYVGGSFSNARGSFSIPLYVRLEPAKEDSRGHLRLRDSAVGDLQTDRNVISALTH